MYSNIKMTQYYEHRVSISDGQRANIKKAIESNCFETLCPHDILLLRKVTENVFTSHLNLHLLQSLFNLRLSLQLREGGRAAFYWIHWILDVAAVPDLPSHPSSIPYS